MKIILKYQVLTYSFSALFFSSCGIRQPKYVQYEDPNKPHTTPDPGKDCNSGSETFAVQIAPILSKCVSCHGLSGNPAQAKLSLGEDSEANRKAIMKSSKYQSDLSLYDFISSDQHPGKSASSTGDQKAWVTWRDAEATCL